MSSEDIRAEPAGTDTGSAGPGGPPTALDVDGRRVLVIDDNVHIHDDFRKILGRADSHEQDEELDRLSASLFGGDSRAADDGAFFVRAASQGQEGLEMVRKSVSDRRPYSLAFVDMRMPPGWNGVETIGHLWEVDPKIQMVICTAYSDFSWAEVLETLGDTGRLHLLRKPFEPDQVRKLAGVLCNKWVRLRDR